MIGTHCFPFWDDWFPCPQDLVCPALRLAPWNASPFRGIDHKMTLILPVSLCRVVRLPWTSLSQLSFVKKLSGGHPMTEECRLHESFQVQQAWWFPQLASPMSWPCSLLHFYRHPFHIPHSKPAGEDSHLTIWRRDAWVLDPFSLIQSSPIQILQMIVKTVQVMFLFILLKRGIKIIFWYLHKCRTSRPNTTCDRVRALLPLQPLP